MAVDLKPIEVAANAAEEVVVIPTEVVATRVESCWQLLNYVSASNVVATVVIREPTAAQVAIVEPVATAGEEVTTELFLPTRC